MKKAILISTLLVVTGCAGTTEKTIYGNPFDLTDSEVTELLNQHRAMYVTSHRLTSYCPVAAARVAQLGGGAYLADCVLFNPIRVYIASDQSEVNLINAQRHAASHVYDVIVRGATVAETEQHISW